MAMVVVRPTMWFSRQVWPPPGCRPICRKRESNRAHCRPATAMSQARTIFMPAPTAAPFTAATVASGEWATRRNPS